jgi:hypothetical protein
MSDACCLLGSCQHMEGNPMPTLELTRDEIIQEMDRVSKDRLGMTAYEVLSRYAAGHLEEVGEVGDVLVLADLLDPSDPIFVP